MVVADEAGRAPVFRIELKPAASTTVTRLTGDTGAYTDLQIAPDGASVYALRSAVDRPPAPVRLNSRAVDQQPVDLLGPEPAPNLSGRLTEVHATATDGTALRSWLVLPDAITTPMLVVHRDYRVPVGEALRLWWDLLSRHQAAPDTLPHRFLYFPDENHWVLRPQNSALWYATVLAFLAHHVLAEPWSTPNLCSPDAPPIPAPPTSQTMVLVRRDPGTLRSSATVCGRWSSPTARCTRRR